MTSVRYSHDKSNQMKSKDVFLGITTSGESINIIEALKECKKIGAQTILLTGKSGGKCKTLSDYSIIVPSDSTQIIQEIHILIYHSICECVENEFFGKERYI